MPAEGLVANWLSSVLIVLAGAGALALVNTTTVPRVRSMFPAQSQGVCCCQLFVQRWQFGWMTPASCTQAHGTCVSPDHCG